MKHSTENKIPLPSAMRAIEEREKLRIIRLQGSMDVAAAEELQRFIPRFRKQPGFAFKNMILDFKEVTDTDSAGVAQLVKSCFDYKQAQHTVGVVNLAPGPRNILEVMKLDKALRIYSSEAAAIQDLDK